MSSSPIITNFSRRIFVKTSIRVIAGIVVAAPFASLASLAQIHTLSFYHTHTGETLDLDFSLITGKPEKERDIVNFLRDFRTGEKHSIDYRLLDMLCHLQRECGSLGRFEVISGYRSPATNKQLRNASSGVAKNSLHMKGRAIDIRLSDVSSKKVRATAQAMQRGGVGYYPRSDFIHLDTGSVRSW